MRFGFTFCWFGPAFFCRSVYVDLLRIWKDAVLDVFKIQPINLRGRAMEMGNKSDNHECHGRDTSEETPECDAGVRNTQQRRSWREEQRTMMVIHIDISGLLFPDELLVPERVCDRCLPTVCAQFCNEQISSSDRDVCLTYTHIHIHSQDLIDSLGM